MSISKSGASVFAVWAMAGSFVVKQIKKERFKMKNVLLVAVVMCGGMVIAESTSNPWRLTVGPAWRSRVTASISGSAQSDAVSASHTVIYDKDIAGKTSWSIGDVTTVPDPASDNGFAPPGSTLYAAEAILTERTVTANDSMSRVLFTTLFIFLVILG